MSRATRLERDPMRSSELYRRASAAPFDHRKYKRWVNYILGELRSWPNRTSTIKATHRRTLMRASRRTGTRNI